MSKEKNIHNSLVPEERPDHVSPYPLSRLAPPISLVDMAREIEQADKILGVRLTSKLKVIADQINRLQEEARNILEKSQEDRKLHHVRCNFLKIPGKTYHLYEKNSGERYFSMLSPIDWKGKPPHRHIGSFRLEADMSWRNENKKR